MAEYCKGERGNDIGSNWGLAKGGMGSQPGADMFPLTYHAELSQIPRLSFSDPSTQTHVYLLISHQLYDHKKFITATTSYFYHKRS